MPRKSPLRTGQCGAAMVEAAIALPVLLALILGFFDLTSYAGRKYEIEDALRITSRHVGTLPPDKSCEGEARAKLRAVLEHKRIRLDDSAGAGDAAFSGKWVKLPTMTSCVFWMGLEVKNSSALFGAIPAGTGYMTIAVQVVDESACYSRDISWGNLTQMLGENPPEECCSSSPSEPGC